MSGEKWWRRSELCPFPSYTISMVPTCWTGKSSHEGEATGGKTVPASRSSQKVRFPHSCLLV